MTHRERATLLVSLAPVVVVAALLGLARSGSRTELVYRSDDRGDLQAAIEARVSGTPSRVRGGDGLWSVFVRDEDRVSSERSLDWDGTLAIFAPCLPEGEDPAPDTSAAIRDIVEAEPPGPRVRLYQATSVDTARARCVESPALLHVVSRDAHASLDERPAAIAVTLDAHDQEALTELGRTRASAAVVIAIRRTILSEATLPLGITDGTVRLPIVGGDIAPLYAEFFAPGLRTPPLAPMTLLSTAPMSRSAETGIAMLVGLIVTLALGLAARRIEPETPPVRIAASVALGMLAAGITRWIAVDTHDATTHLELAGASQALSAGAAALVVLWPGRAPRRAGVLLSSSAVALGFAIDRAASDYLLLAHDASIGLSLLAAVGRVSLAGLWGFALSTPQPNRLARVTVAWAVASLLEGLALTLMHAGA